MNKYLSIKLQTLSFLLIIMVVFLHSYNISPLNIIRQNYNFFIQHFISEEITRIAVPLFFAISGYLFFLGVKGKIDEFVDKFKKRTKSLVIPYLFWSSIWIIIYYCLQSIPQTKSFFLGKRVSDFSATDFLDTLFINPIPFQFWFIRDLIVLVLLSPIIYFLIKKIKYLLAISLLITWYLNLNFYLFLNESVLFFTIGASLSISNSQVLTKVYSKKHLIIPLIWVLFCVFLTLIAVSNTANLLLISFLHKTAILLGIASIWILYDLFSKDKKEKPPLIYSFSFFIFAFHLPLMTFVRAILFKLGNTEFISFSIYLIAPIIVIFSSLFIGSLLKRALPDFYKIINGGR